MSYPLDWIGITLLVIDLVCPIDCDSFEPRVFGLLKNFLDSGFQTLQILFLLLLLHFLQC